MKEKHIAYNKLKHYTHKYFEFSTSPHHHTFNNTSWSISNPIFASEYGFINTKKCTSIINCKNL